MAMVEPNAVTDVAIELQVALLKESMTVTASAETISSADSSEQSSIGRRPQCSQQERPY
jgi:hypothetical protein